MARSIQVEREIRAALMSEGADFTVTRSARGHFLIRSACGAIVAVVPGSPGDVRWLRNLRGDVRRARRAHDLRHGTN